MPPLWRCSNCGYEASFQELQEAIVFTRERFIFTCPQCGHREVFDTEEVNG